MRLKIINRFGEPETVIPIVRFCAQYFPSVTGTIKCTVGKLRNGIWRGWQLGRTIYAAIEKDPSRHLPIRHDTLNYFRSHGIPIEPYEIHTREEALVHVVAHEMAHLTKPGSRGRRSRMEVYCENRATEVLEAFRSDEGKAFIFAERAKFLPSLITKKQPPTLTDKRLALSAELVRLDELLTRWDSKLRRAENAIKKLNRKRARKLKTLEAL